MGFFCSDFLVEVSIKLIVSRVSVELVIRIPKAYPAYFGSYDKFPAVRQFLDPLDNLLLIGRNGMHRYNNMDHSMLTAKLAVDYVRGELQSKDSIWDVNAEEDYHEEK